MHDNTNVLTDMCTFSPFGIHIPLTELDTYIWSEENEQKEEYQLFDKKETAMIGPELTEDDQIEIGQNDGTGYPPPPEPASDDTTDEIDRNSGW